MKRWELTTRLALFGLFFNGVAQASEPSSLPPEITSIAPTTAQVGELYSYQVEAIDPESGPLSYELYVLPTGMTISSTGLVSWTPTIAGAGEQTFKVTVRDQAGLEVSQYVDLLVEDPSNNAPVINQEPVTNFNIGTTYTYDLQASDADGDTLSYSVWSWPEASGLSVSTQGLLTWSPVNRDQAGVYWVSVEVSDGRLGKTKREFELSAIDATNQAPVIAGTPATQTNIDTVYTYDLQVSDADGDALSYELSTWPTDLGVLLSENGVMTWTPSRDNVGENWISIKVHDGHLGQDEIGYELNVVDPNNHNPVFTSTPITQATQGIEYEYLITVSDADSDAVNLTLFDGPQGMVLDTATNTLRWTPAQVSAEGVGVKIDARDNYGGFARQEYTLIVNEGGSNNNAPVANSQSIVTTEDAPLSISLSASDPDGQALSYSIMSQPLYGTLSGSGAQWVYTPQANFFGADSFTFVASDGALSSNLASVSISVNSANDAPLAENITAETSEDTALDITLIGSDVDGDSLTYTVAVDPSNGSLSGSAPDLSYTPAADFSGTDVFTYSVSDGSVSSGFATVTITVNAENDAPTANNIALQTAEETAVDVMLIGNDVDGDTLTYTLVGQVQNGSLSGTAPALTYTPNIDFTGTDTFTYRVNDGLLDSELATVSITISTVNDAPVAQNITQQTNEDTVSTIHLLATDADQDVLTYHVVSQPQHGVLSGSGSELTYIPGLNYVGSDSFTYRANDGTADSNIAIVSIAVVSVNDVPFAQNLSVQTVEDTALPLTLAGSDSDGDTLAYVIDTQPSQGVLSGSAPNLIYTPNANVSGSDSFTYHVNDGQQNSAIATVNITVTPLNDNPVANALSISLFEDTPANITLQGGDPDGDSLSYTLVSQPQRGVLTGSGANLIYTPNTNINGTDSFSYSVSDGQSTSNVATVSLTITNVNDAPVVQDLNLQTAEESALSVSLLGSDADNDSLTYTLVSQPANGVLSGSAPDLSYTPNANFTGSDSFTYRANDGQADSAVATVNISVTNTNDAPVAQNGSGTVNEDASLVLTLQASDDDGDALTFEITTPPQNGMLSGIGSEQTYTPNANYNGPDSFTYRANDGTVNSNTAIVTINVNPVNDAPVANAASANTQANQPVDINLSANDIDGDILAYRIVTQAQNGTVTLVDNVATYTPTTNFSGADSFTFVANDGVVDSDAVEVQITVTQANSAPQITSQPGLQAVENTLYQYQVIATDNNSGDTLTYRLNSSPSGATINAATGLVEWTPDTTQSSHNIDNNPYCLMSSESQLDERFADIVFAVDRSLSMGGETEWIQVLASLLDAHLIDENIGGALESNLFGLVSFDGSVRNFTMGTQGELFAVSPDFYSATQTFYANGNIGREDGWAAIDQVLQYPFRSSAAKNVILITDEDRDNLDANLTFESVRAGLQSANAILNAVVNANFVCEDTRPALGLGQGNVGYVADGFGGFELCENATVIPDQGTTEEDYVNLALASNGAAWDLSVLRSGGRDAQSFVKALMSIKVEEIEKQFETTAQADLVVENLIYDGSTLSAVIKNRGLVDITSPVTVNFLDGANLITQFTLTELLVGATQTLSYGYSNPTGTMSASVLAEGVDECSVDNNQLSAWAFDLSVEDGSGLSTTQRFDISITNSNQAPQITSTAPTVAPYGSEYIYEVVVNDPDVGDGLHYQLSSAPEGMVIDAVSGVVRFTPTVSQQGTHDITLVVTDINGLTDQQSYVLIVDNSYEPLRFISEPSIRVIQSQEYRYQAQVQSDTTAVLVFSLFSAPEGMTVNAQTGEVVWQIPADAPGREYPFVLQVADQFGNIDIQAYELIGDFIPTAPVLNTTAIGGRTVGSEFTHRLSYSDTNYLQNVNANHIKQEDLAVFSLLDGPAGAVLETEVASGTRFGSCQKSCGSFLFSQGNLTWTTDVSNPGTPLTRTRDAGIDPFCRVSDSINTEFEITQRIANSNLKGKPIAGPLYDSNHNGQLDDGDRRFLFATNGVVIAVDPITLKEVWQTNTSVHRDSRGTLIDLDGDASAELIFFDNAYHLVVFNSDGTLRWRSAEPAAENFVRTHAMPVDLDNDGSYEILFGPSVYDANGNLLWRFSTAFPNNTFGQFSAYSTALPVDFDLDGVSEVVYFNQVRDAQGNLLWELPLGTTNSSSNVQVNYAFANFDDDPEPELVVNAAFFVNSVGGYTRWLRLVDNDGSLIWQTNEGVLGTGNLAIADVDNDNDLEIYSATSGALFDHTGSIIWQNGALSGGQRYSNALIADVNGDGSLDIIDGYTDAIYILDAASGLLINQFPTRQIFSRVDDIMYADIDNDNQGEIVLTSNDAPLTVFESANGNWADAPSVYAYNQQSFGDINNQLRIDSARGNYFSQITSVVPVNGTPVADQLRQDNRADVFVNAVYADYQYTSRDPEEWRVHVTLGNRGSVVAEDLLVEFYTDDPNNAANRFGELTVASIEPNATRTLSLSFTDDAVLGSEIFARVSSATAECNVNNNIASAATFDIQVTDSDGLFDRAKISVGGIANHNVRVTSTAPTQATVGEQYTYQVEAEGNGYLAYNLESRVSGMILNPQTGFISWVPTADQVSPGQIVSVNVEDTVLGYNTEHRFSVAVLASSTPNNDPTITSTPVTQASTAQAYRYQVLANDEDNHNITYSLVNAPAGMTINRLSGLVSWPAPVIGSHSVTLRATDEQDAFAEQSYSLTVAANNAPVITSSPLIFARINRNYVYQIQANDPDGQPLTYTLLTAPVGMSLSATGLLSWLPTEQAQAPVSVRVSDGLNSVTQSWTVDVLSADDALAFNVGVSSEFVNEGDTVTINYFPFNAIEPYTITATIDGQALEVVNNQSSITAAGIGPHVIEASLTDPYDTVTASTRFSVRDPADLNPPLVSLVQPLNRALVTAPTAIVGAASDANLTYWRLSYAKRNTSNFVTLAEGTANVAEQTLATFDPTLLDNGQYVIALEAADVSGQQTRSTIVVTVEGELKVGHFSFTVEDINVPLAGLPIRVTRTYDSRRKSEALDFGYGWSIGYQNASVEESRHPGQGWVLNSYPGSGPGGLLTNYCVEPQGAPEVSVKLPTGEVERFEVAASPRCNLAIPVIDVTLAFNAIGDNQSTLEALEQTNGRLVSNTLADISDSSVLNPDRYRLTTRAGYVYTLNQNFGIETVTDPNGHTLTYSDSGIVHSSGKSVDFIRDANGRIEEVRDPAGNAIIYDYDSNGDLYTVTERDGAVTTHSYYGSNCATAAATTDCHLVNEILDPLGRRVVRNLYDEDGRLRGQVDENGIEKLFDHNIDARTSLVTDRDGRSTLFVYDDRGNVTSETLIISDGSYLTDIVTNYTYDGNDNQETRSIGSSIWTSLHDLENNVTESRNPEGESVFYDNYNSRGQEGRITDERGHVYDMTYDIAGNLYQLEAPEVIDPDTGEASRPIAGNVINSRGLIESTTDLRGLTTSYTYYTTGPARDQKHTESNPVTGTITYTYDANNNVETETRQRTVNGAVVDETTTYAYDERNRLERTTYPDGTYTQTEYDLAGNVERSRDRFGNWTTTDYDVYGRLRLTTYADGTTESRTYTDEGLLETVTDRSGLLTRNEYDDAGRLWRVHNDSDNTFTETRYTEQGWVRQEYDQNRNLTEYEYDLAGRRERVIRHIDGGTQIHRFTYYPNGELHTETDALGHTTTYILNELDQRIDTQYHNGTSMQDRFDFMGTRTQSTDQESRSTRFVYDDVGRLTSVTPEVSIEGIAVPDTLYSYDEVGNRLTQTDAENRQTIWTYDFFGRVRTRTLPEGMSESFVYVDGQGCAPNAGSACAATASPRTMVHIDFNGDTITTAYDVMGRTISVDYSKDGNSEVYTYYNNDQVHTVTDQHGTTTYVYDVNHRLESETRPDGTVMTYDYDDVGNRTLVSVTRNGTLSSSTTYTYDALNRLESVNDSSGITTYTYDAVGNMDTVIYPNGLVTDYDYNTINQLTDVLTRDGLGTLIEHFNYQLTPTGRREVIAELSGRTTAYCYDNLYRLSDEVVFDSLASPLASGCVSDTTGASYIAHYEYDWVGNRSSETVDGVSTNYTYDDNDRLTQVGGTRYVYDDNGNTETETLDGVVKTYTWDGKNKLVQQDAAGVVSSYTYNHNGVRNSKTENGVTIAFVVDENRDYAQVLEDVVNDVATAQYTYGHDLIRQERSGVNSYYHYDGLGSTRALSDASGSLTDTYDYEAFGEVLDHTGSTENNYLFTGEQFDGGLNQYYLRARYYNQSNGRFTQMDTFAGVMNDPQTLHKYLYTGSDPVNRTDPSGYFYGGGGGLVGMTTATKIMNTLAVISIGRIEFMSFDSEGKFTDTQVGWLTIAGQGGPGTKAFELVKEKVDERNDPTIDLSRAVGDSELASMYSCSCFSLGPNAFPKQFFHSQSEAIEFGNKSNKGLYNEPYFHTVEVTISIPVYELLDHKAYEPNIGPIVTVPSNLLPIFNFEMNRNGGFRYEGMH